MSQRRLFSSTLLVGLACAEEHSILDGATMIDRDNDTDRTFNAIAICDAGFKSRAKNSGTLIDPAGRKEFVMTLSEQKSIKTAFVQNFSYDKDYKMRMGESALYVGTDTGAFSAGMAKCTDYFFDSGFYSIKCNTQGKNVAVRRDSLPNSTDISYNINEVRLFQTINLLELADVKISAPAPTEPKWAATNLITNFTRRTPGNDLPPLIDKTGTTATWESCFKTGPAQLTVEGHKLVINIDLGASYFQHAVLVVQDLFQGTSATGVNDEKKFFQNFEIYIGNSPNWADNPKVPGGPHMRTDDAKSYVDVSYSQPTPAYTGRMWRFGKEVWCNMEGRYMTIVADLKHLAGQLYEMSLCHLAVFGALYKRITPVPLTLKVVTGTPYELDVEKIRADEMTPITNTLEIALRQKAGTELPWVTFSQYNLVTRVSIAPDSSVPPGDYTVVLESFDQAGGVYSALKTDTITVTVAKPCPISANQITAVAETLAADPLNISVAALKVGSAQADFSHKYAQIVGQLAFDATMQQQCGSISISLITKHAFLMHLPNTKLLFLKADGSTEPGVFDDSFLQVIVNNSSFKIPIRVEFTSCTVTRLSFEQSMLGLLYEVGSGSQQLELPRLVKKPDCGIPFEKLFIKTIESGQISPQVVQAAVKLDPSKNAIFVTTFDPLFIGKSATVIVATEAAQVDSKSDLQVLIQFSGVSPTQLNQQTIPPSAALQANPNAQSSNITAAAAQATGDLEQVVSLEVAKKLGAELGIPDLVVPRVTQAQAIIIETPLNELSSEQLFSEVPLAARLTQGVENLQEFVLRQREMLTRKTESFFAQKQSVPPEVRFEGFSNFGMLELSFTKKINFPPNLEEAIRRANPSIRLLAADDSASAKNAIQIFAIKGAESNEDDIGGPLLKHWELISLRADGITIKVHFFKPLHVSAGATQDFLIVQLELGEYKDDEGNSLEKSIVKKFEIPTQFASAAEANSVYKVGETFEASSYSAMVLNFVVNILISGSLAPIWSLVNSLQVVQANRLFNVIIPGNVNAFTTFAQKLASVQLFEDLTTLMVQELLLLPEQDPFSVHFMNAGFESKFFMVNLKQQLLLHAVFIALGLLVAGLWPLAKCCRKVFALRQRLIKSLFWNSYIRLLMESYADVMLFALMNLCAKDWPAGFDAVKADIVVTCVVLATYALLPFVLLLVVCKKYHRHVRKNTVFAERVGSFLQGTSREKRAKPGVLLYTLTFYLRRLALALTLVLWQDFFWGQIFVQFAVSTCVIILLQLGRPLETRFANNIETFNECMSLQILFLLLTFTPFVPEPETRNSLGFVYIVEVGFFVAVHFSLITWSKIRSLKEWLRRRCVRRRAQLAAQARNARQLSRPEIQKNQVRTQNIIPAVAEANGGISVNGTSDSQLIVGSRHVRAQAHNRKPRLEIVHEAQEKTKAERSSAQGLSAIGGSVILGGEEDQARAGKAGAQEKQNLKLFCIDALDDNEIDWIEQDEVQKEQTKTSPNLQNKKAEDRSSDLVAQWPLDIENEFWPNETDLKTENQAEVQRNKTALLIGTASHQNKSSQKLKTAAQAKENECFDKGPRRKPEFPMKVVPKGRTATDEENPDFSLE